MSELSHENALIWQRLTQTNHAYYGALYQFMVADLDRVSLFKRVLKSKDREIGLQIASHLSVDELMQLLPELVFLVSWWHGMLEKARTLILSLPRDWVLKHIEETAEPFLQSDPENQSGTADEYRRFLELYLLLDRDLTLRLAKRAVSNPDPGIREAGEDFLEKLGIPQN